MITSPAPALSTLSNSVFTWDFRICGSFVASFLLGAKQRQAQHHRSASLAGSAQHRLGKVPANLTQRSRNVSKRQERMPIVLRATIRLGYDVHASIPSGQF